MVGPATQPGHRYFLARFWLREVKKMTVSLFSNLFVNGLAMGMVYAMLAIGLILLI